ncbi:aldo/keto reductase, partial [candidate division KSB1 bacterium]
RRHFIRNLSFSFAGALTAVRCAKCNKAGTDETGKMKYRMLGRTGMRVSEVALGGHFTGMGWQEKGSKRQSLRNEVIGEAYKQGINFFDTNEVSESEKIGIALEANGIKRDKILLSADTNAYDGVGKNKSAKEIIADTIDEVDRHIAALKTSYVDIFRYTTWSNEFNEMGLKAGVEAFKILKKDGKARHFAISNHNPKDLFRMIDEIPQLEILYIPYSYITTKAEEVLPAANKKGIGVICIKPFVRGTLFKLKSIDLSKMGGVMRKWLEETDKTPEELLKDTKLSLAMANLRFILDNKNISTVIPGMETVEEVKENIRASYEEKLTDSETALLDSFWNNHQGEHHINEMCSGNYHFLRQWRS